MRVSRPVFIGAFIVVIAGAAAYARLRLHPGDDPNTLRVSGNVEVTTTEVSFRIPGRVLERLVTEGDTVTKGQLVARLDSLDIASQVAQRRAELDLARALLAELEAGSRPEEIAEARAELDRARSDADRARLDLDRTESLLSRKLAVSQQEFDTADSTAKSAAATARQKEQRLALLIKGPRLEQINQAKARLAQAQQALVLTETQLSYASVSSPLSGLVLSKNIEPGEYVAPGTPVLTVGDMEHPWVRAYISAIDLGRVTVGQAVRVQTDSYPEKIYPGRITYIASEAEFTPKSVQTSKERVNLVYRIKVDVANPHMELKAGMPVDGVIVLDRSS
jgi:HlyD family secretion protein